MDNLFELYENKNQCLDFNKVFKTYSGGTFKSANYVSHSKYKLITIKNIDDSGFNTKNVSYLSKKYADNKYLLQIGDIVLTMTGNIGRHGIVNEKYCYLNQRLLKMECISPMYLICFLRKYKNEIIKLGRGTAQKNLSLSDLINIKIHNTIEEVQNFQKFDLFYKKIVHLSYQINKYSEIKLLLLKKYFSTNQ